MRPRCVCVRRFSQDIQKGQYFGELGLVFDRRRTANVRAMSNLEVCKFNKDDFFEVLNRFPEYAKAVLITGTLRRPPSSCDTRTLLPSGFALVSAQLTLVGLPCPLAAFSQRTSGTRRRRATS